MQKNVVSSCQPVLFCSLQLVGNHIKTSCESLRFLLYEHLLLEELNNSFTEIREGDSCREFSQPIVHINKARGASKMYECYGSYHASHFSVSSECFINSKVLDSEAGHP